MNAADLFDDMLRQVVVPITKPLGWKRKRANFHRRIGKTVHVLNFQASQASSSTERVFYVNFCIAFDELCSLVGKEVNDQIAESSCDDVGLRVRMHDLDAETPDLWHLSLGRSAPVMAKVSGALKTLLSETEVIDGIVAFSRHPAFERPRTCKAQALYLLGRQAEARAVFEVLFSGETDFQRANFIMRRLGLGAIADLR